MKTIITKAALFAALFTVAGLVSADCSFITGSPAYQGMVEACGGRTYSGTCDGQGGPLCAAVSGHTCTDNTAGVSGSGSRYDKVER